METKNPVLPSSLFDSDKENLENSQVKTLKVNQL